MLAAHALRHLWSTIATGRILPCIGLLVIVLATIPAHGSISPDCIHTKTGHSVYQLDGSISFYEDRSTTLSFQDLQSKPQQEWTLLKEAVPSFGFSESAYWLKLTLCEQSSPAEPAVLEVSYPLLDSVRVIATEGRETVYDMESGDRILFSQRPVKHRNFVFLLPAMQTAATIYIRVESESAVQIPVNLYTADGFFEHNQNVLSLQGIYFGCILAMIIYNAFLFFSLREWPYLLYVFFTISYFSFQGVLQGFFQQFLFDSVWWQTHALLLFGYLAILFANLFAVSFLNLRKKNPILSGMLLVFGLCAALAAAFAPVLPYAPMVKLMLSLAVPSSLLIMFAGFKRWWSGHLPARVFTLAWSTLLISFVLASLNKFGILPRIFLTEDVMQIGGVLEVLLLSIALGERINEEKRQRIIIEQNLSSSLEKMVDVRTRALHEALVQLENANAILDKISLTDSLTQTANRRAFDQQLELGFKSAVREGENIALIMIDIDNFKHFNDTYGHQAGDRVLQNVAATLRAIATRPRDMVYRYGGEEFAVVLYKTNLSGAGIVAEKMRSAIEKLSILIDDQSFRITISAGIGVYNPDTDVTAMTRIEDLIRQADMQLYLAKAGGRNTVAPAPKAA